MADAVRPSLLRRAALLLGLGALLAGGCAGPEPAPLWADDAAGPPPSAPAGDGWAFVAAGRYGEFEDDDDDDRAAGGHHLGPTVVPAGYRGEDGSSERAFSAAALQRANFTGFSTPAAGAPVDAPPDQPVDGAAFQPLREVPR